MLAGRGVVDEATGRLDDDVGAECGPREQRRILLGDDLDGLAADDDGVALDLDGLREATEDRVVLQQVGEGLDIGEIVDADDLHVRALLEDRAEVVTTNAAEAVDADLDGHVVS